MKSTTSILRQLIHNVRKFIWSFVVAYMLGIHNFYYGDDRTADESINTIEVRQEQESGTPKD